MQASLNRIDLALSVLAGPDFVDGENNVKVTHRLPVPLLDVKD